MALPTAFPAATTIAVREPFLKTQCELGEGVARASADPSPVSLNESLTDSGPVWDPRTQTLHFIDILNPRLYHYCFETGKLDIQEVWNSLRPGFLYCC